jgi:hypothetical protein
MDKSCAPSSAGGFNLASIAQMRRGDRAKSDFFEREEAFAPLDRARPAS